MKVAAVAPNIQHDRLIADVRLTISLPLSKPQGVKGGRSGSGALKILATGEFWVGDLTRVGAKPPGWSNSLATHRRDG
jgi:hypothetical protein